MGFSLRISAEGEGEGVEVTDLRRGGDCALSPLTCGMKGAACGLRLMVAAEGQRAAKRVKMDWVERGWR